MFTLHVFAATTTSPSSLTNIAPVSDPALATSGNFMFVPILNNLIGAMGLGLNLTRLQLSTPSLLADVPLDVTPVDNARLPSSPPIQMFHPEDPIKLVTDEPLQALVTQTSSVVANGAVFLSDGPLTKVSGRILRVRATATTVTGSALTWQNVAMTLTNQLAEGTYQLVGARVEGTNSYFARFVFPGGSNATRPGLPVVGGKSNIALDRIFRNGALGVWGTFTNRLIPSIDVLNDGGSDSLVIIMDLIKTS